MIGTESDRMNQIIPNRDKIIDRIPTPNDGRQCVQPMYAPTHNTNEKTFVDFTVARVLYIASLWVVKSTLDARPTVPPPYTRSTHQIPTPFSV